MLFRRLILILKQPAEKQKQKTLRLSAISDVLLYIWFISKNNMAAKVLQSVGYETQQALRLEFKKETNERMNELTKRLQFLFSFKETLGCVSWVIAVMVCFFYCISRASIWSYSIFCVLCCTSFHVATFPFPRHFLQQYITRAIH